MKRIVFLFIALFFAATLQAQKPNEHYSSSKLSPGYPAEVSLFVENLPDVKSTTLETGVDSMKVYFGSFSRNPGKVYWASLYYNKRNTFRMFELQESDSSKMVTEVLEFKLNNTSMKISVRVLYNPTTDEVFYQWMDEDGVSEILTVQEVERLIEKNAPMPHFSVKTLGGQELSLDDYDGKYLIINWWQTTCAPCLLEMPGLNEMVEKYKFRTDVAFLAIADDDKETLESFLTERNFTYQQALANTEVTAIFGNAYPKHIIVNPQGVVTYYLEGGNAKIHQEIDKALRGQLKN